MTEAEWKAECAVRREQREAGGGCIGCTHGFHLHECLDGDCSCNNQGRTETMADRRASCERQRQESEDQARAYADRVAAVIRKELSLDDNQGDHLFKGMIDPDELAEAIVRRIGEPPQ